MPPSPRLPSVALGATAAVLTACIVIAARHFPAPADTAPRALLGQQLLDMGTGACSEPPVA